MEQVMGFLSYQIEWRTTEDNGNDVSTIDDDGMPKDEGYYWCHIDPFGWRMTGWDGPYTTHEDAAEAAGAD
jgi:hypothetical protein